MATFFTLYFAVTGALFGVVESVHGYWTTHVSPAWDDLKAKYNRHENNKD